MEKERAATVIVTLDLLGIEEKKYFRGTEEEIYAEANDFMKEAYYQLTDNAKDLTNLDDDVRKQVEKAWDKNSRGIKVFSISSLKETHEDLYNKAINAGAKYFV